MERVNERQQRINLKKIYLTKWDNCVKQLSHLTKISTIVGWLRLGFFVAAISLPIILTPLWSASFLIYSATFITCFTALVIYSNRIAYAKKYTSTKKELFEKELRIIEGDWQNEYEGTVYINPEHDFSYDLDLFGQGSLFQYINRTSLIGGEQRLSKQITSQATTKDDIYKNQEAIRELSELESFREEFYTLGYLAEENKNRKQPLDNLFEVSVTTLTTRVISFLIPVLTIIAFSFYLLGILESNVLFQTFLLGLLISAFYYKRINTVHAKLSKLGDLLNRYSLLINLIENQNFQSSKLKDLKGQLHTNSKPASHILKSLSFISSQLDIRLNILMGAVLNGLFMWDLIVCHLLHQWNSKYGHKLPIWFATLYELDALISLATFKYNHPNYVFPEIVQENIIKSKVLLPFLWVKT